MKNRNLVLSQLIFAAVAIVAFGQSAPPTQPATNPQNSQNQQQADQKSGDFPDPWDSDSGDGSFKLTDGTDPFAAQQPDANNGQMPADGSQPQTAPQAAPQQNSTPQKTCGEFSADGDGFRVVFVFHGGTINNPDIRVERSSASQAPLTAAEVAKMNAFHGAAFFPDQNPVDVPIYFEDWGSSCSSDFHLPAPTLKGRLTIDGSDMANPQFVIPPAVSPTAPTAKSQP